MPSTSFNMLSDSKRHKAAMQLNSRSGRRCGNRNTTNTSTTTNRHSRSRSDNVLPTPSKRNNAFDGCSHQRKSKLSITTGKCSSINPYRILILLVIGFPGLNTGKLTAMLPTQNWLLHFYSYNIVCLFHFYLFINFILFCTVFLFA